MHRTQCELGKLKKTLVNNNNNNNTRTMFMVLSSYCSSIARVHPGSRGERSTAPGGRRPLDQSPPVGCQLTTLTIAILLLLSPKADTHFTIPRKVEGWVDLVGWLHTEMVYPLAHGHPSKYTDRARRRVTSLIESRDQRVTAKPRHQPNYKLCIHVLYTTKIP